MCPGTYLGSLRGHPSNLIGKRRVGEYNASLVLDDLGRRAHNIQRHVERGVVYQCLHYFLPCSVATLEG